MKVCGVYCILNTANDKRYIGSTSNLNSRHKTHFSNLRKNGHCNDHLQSAWNMYGEQVFQFLILEITDNLFEREQYWIDHFGTNVNSKGYNICPVAGSTLGVKFSPEACRRRSESRKGQGNSFFGRKHSDETKKKIGKVIGDKYQGVGNPFYNKRHNADTRKKISESKIGSIREKYKNVVFKGVYKLGNKWLARIRYLRKMYYLGSFDSSEEAARNYDFYAKLMYGEKAVLNFLDGDETFVPKKTIDVNKFIYKI